MKRTFALLTLLAFTQFTNAQEIDADKIYQSAIESYTAKDFKKSAEMFSKLIGSSKEMQDLSDYVLFQGAIMFAENDDQKNTFKILNFLNDERYYSEFEKLNHQKEFEKWHSTEDWKKLITKTKENDITKPARTKLNIKTKLFEAKSLLRKDNGKLWGHKIWNDSIIVIDYDHTIYSLTKLSNNKTDDDTLYYKTMEPNSISFVNTTQKYEEKKYATVLTNYLNDRSSTVIHELFHILQSKFRKFKGDAIPYLDETNARILLRLEFQALRNALKAINENKGIAEIKIYLKDAVSFRKVRQKQYSNYLTNELEIETLEGLANYTGFALSGFENKYEKAILEIDKREDSETYTRSFPYATGPAYGFIFDHLDIDWKNGLDKIYNFAEIYETKVNKSELEFSEKTLKEAKARNNFDEIRQKEITREERHKKLITYYTDLLINKPTLKVAVADLKSYGRSFNMNGTLTLSKGTVYSSIKGTDRSKGKNFGDFTTIDGKSKLGEAGILSYTENGITYFVFPLPTDISETKISGEFYEIELNPNWKLIKKNDGNMEIVIK